MNELEKTRVGQETGGDLIEPQSSYRRRGSTGAWCALIVAMCLFWLMVWFVPEPREVVVTQRADGVVEFVTEVRKDLPSRNSLSLNHYEAMIHQYDSIESVETWTDDGSSKDFVKVVATDDESIRAVAAEMNVEWPPAE